MNSIERQVAIEALEARLRFYRSITVCCGNCEHFRNISGTEPLCEVFKEAPPPEAQRGPIECPEWLLGDIPF